ncbi:hypothetical protein [Metamycoplasma arthritidis]|uniref:Conserved protein n=1 Tax=Metamycoplasma arthritidis (strain 158L3-1) TaxID=243272 RepID=B3PM45_META1|nr:hypothetical protein [Metamycoplasma arthritidis]ACF07097.1 conserved protein [Metamycoplasma arthritidis 158L3-1]
MDGKYILGISLGLALMFALILTFGLVFFFVRKNSKQRELQEKENLQALQDTLSTYAKSNNSLLLKKATYKYDKNKIFSSGPILISPFALFVIYPFFAEGEVDGNCLEREWSHQFDNKKKIFPNPVLKNDLVIKHILNLIPQQVPIISLMLLIENNAKYDIYNLPDYLLLCKEDELFDSLNDAKNELEAVLDNEAIIKISDTLKKFQQK